MYTINDARREMKEHEQLMKELIESENFKGYSTL